MPALAPLPPARLTTRPPEPRRWTNAEFHFVGDHGLFEGRRPLLIDGTILEQGEMPPAVACGIGVVAEVMYATFPSGWRVRQQQPLPFNTHTDPVPNVSVVCGSPRDMPDRHPTSAALVIEIADANNFSINTTTKVGVYAAGGIAEYWVVDVNGRQLLVFRDPQPDPSQPQNHTYATQLTLGPNDTVSPLAAPNSAIRVADLLP